MPLPKPMTGDQQRLMTGDQQRLSNCLGRVEQVEKALFTALSDIADTRQAIVEMLQNGVEVQEETSPSKANSAADSPARTTLISSGVISSDDSAPMLRSLSEEEQRVQECAMEAGKKLGLSKEEVAKAHQVFCEHDADSSGVLSRKEVHTMLQQLSKGNLSKRDTDRIFKEVDLNKDAVLDFSEFLMCVCHTPENRTKYLDAAVANKNSSMTRKFTLRMVGLPYAALRGFIRKEIEEMSAFLSIPIIFLLFFCFILSSHLHREVSILHSFEESVRVDIETNANFGYTGIAPFENGREGFKNIYDIQAVEDFWSWMDLGLMPLFFPSGWNPSEARSNVDQYCTSPIDSMVSNGWNAKLFPGNADQYADQKAFYLDDNLCSMNSMPNAFPQSLKSLEDFANATKKPYRFFNEVIAGVRMKQEQLSHQTCPRPDFKGHVYRTPCIEENAWAWLKPDMDIALDMQDDLVGRSGGKTVYFKSATSLTEVKASLQELENERWFNPKTSKIQILLTTYNNHMDLFTATYVNILINRAGNVHKVVEPVCIWLNPYRNKAAWVTDFIMIILVLKLSIEEVIDMARSVGKRGLVKGCQHYFDGLKNFIDWASISFSIVIFTLWIIWCTKVSAFVDLLGTAEADVIGSWPSKADIFTPSNENFWDDVDDLVRYYQKVTYVFAFYPFVIGARLFCTFGSQPRLGLVTATLSSAAKDIIHFLVVLLVVMLIFCSSAEYLFSVRAAEYENFGRTFISVFRAMLGDFEYAELTEVGRLPAALWYLGFMVLVNMIMLNMLLAIIMDVYGSIKAGMSDDEETIWSQTWEIWDRWKRCFQGTALPLKVINKSLSRHKNEFYRNTNVNGVIVQEPNLITVSAFMEIVPALKEEQAVSLMRSAYDWWHAQNDEAVTTLDIQAMVRLIDLKLERAQEVINSIEDRQTRRDSIDEALKERIMGVSNKTITNGRSEVKAMTNKDNHQRQIS